MRALLISLLICSTTAVAMAADPPPATRGDKPAASEPAELPEPPPAPLRVEPEAPAKSIEKPAAAPTARPIPPPPPSERPYRIGGWTGVGLTLAFVVTGTVLGVLAQRDSDALMRLTNERVDNRPVIYDSERQAQYESLSTGGASKNRATIACFIVAGITAVTSGVLFWDASRRGIEQKKAMALVPAIAAERGEARLLLSGRF